MDVELNTFLLHAGGSARNCFIDADERVCTSKGRRAERSGWRSFQSAHGGGYHTAQTAIEDTFQFYGQVLKERRDELLQSLDNMYDEKQSNMNIMQVRRVW